MLLDEGQKLFNKACRVLLSKPVRRIFHYTNLKLIVLSNLQSHLLRFRPMVTSLTAQDQCRYTTFTLLSKPALGIVGVLHIGISLKSYHLLLFTRLLYLFKRSIKTKCAPHSARLLIGSCVLINIFFAERIDFVPNLVVEVCDIRTLVPLDESFW